MMVKSKPSHRGFIHFEVEGLESLKGALEARISGFDAICDSAIEGAAEILVRRMKELCKRGAMYPHGADGSLQDSISAKKLGPRLFAVGPGNLPHARIREYGGVIRAKNAPYLVFQTYDGQWHRCKQVYHPACPYIRPAYAQTAPEMVQYVASHITEAFR